MLDLKPYSEYKNSGQKWIGYHLPFDQQYDRTKIIPALDECYVRTVAEAEERGFRRAFRHVKF
jgi:hypothetical protein